MNNKRIGRVLNIPLFQDEDGDHYLDVSETGRVWITNRCQTRGSIDSFVQDYRVAVEAASLSPRDRVIQAARALVRFHECEPGKDEPETCEAWAKLDRAVEALEDSEDE